MDEEAAYNAIISSENLRVLLDNDPRFLHTEPGFYWAMCIVHGFDSLWWHDKDLWAQHKAYVIERHHPPMDD